MSATEICNGNLQRLYKTAFILQCAPLNNLFQQSIQKMTFDTVHQVSLRKDSVTEQ